MMLLVFGAMIAFLVIIADLLHTVSYCSIAHQSDTSLLDNRDFILFFVTTVFIFPICLLRDISKLEVLSLGAVVIIMVFAGTTVYESFHVGSFHGTSAFKLNTDFFSAISVMSLAYCCQSNIFPVYAELRNPTLGNMRISALTGVTLCGFLYIIAGFCGYVAYGENVQGDWFLNLSTQTGFQVLRCFFCLALFVHYPLTHFALRRSIEQILFPSRPFSWLRHCTETFLAVYTSYALAVSLPSLNAIFSFTGALTSFMIGFILPCAFFIKLMPGERFSRRKIPVWLLMGLSLVLCCIAIVVTFIGIIDYFKNKETLAPPVCSN